MGSTLSTRANQLLEGTEWVSPLYNSGPKTLGILGGSNETWPMQIDGREYLSMWGSAQAPGGCCHYTSKLYTKDINLGKQGWIKEIKTRELGLLLIELGGGRKQVDDKINYHVGYDNVLGVGESIDGSTPVIKVSANSKDDFDKVKNSIINCFVVSDQEVKKSQNIYEVIK